VVTLLNKIIRNLGQHLIGANWLLNNWAQRSNIKGCRDTTWIFTIEGPGGKRA